MGNSFSVMHESWFCYIYRLRFGFLGLTVFSWTNILSEASPLPSVSHEIKYAPYFGEPLNLEGPLLCHGNITAQSFEPQDPQLFCDGATFCRGVTSCNDTLICSQDWVNLNGALACNGELLCNGTLSCNKGPAHPACLPGLGGLPSPALAILMVILIVISGGISGLKSAFMSVDPTDLRVMMDTGTIRERILAGRIYEARQHSESTTLMLCAMTLATVMINHSLPLMAACLLHNHLWGFLLSSALVVIFGEILPLMVFPRFPLLILGNMMWAIYIATSVFCIPACLLSYIYESTISTGLGRPKTIYNNKELGSLVDLHAAWKETGGELSIDTVRVLHGTLEMEKKVARDIMKPLDEVKMKSVDSRMNFHSWAEISDWGYSRIPVYKSLGDNQDACSTYSDFNIKIMGVLHVFDLIFVIVDEITTLKYLPLHKLPVISEDYPLWDLLHLFQEGASHMAIVERGMEEIGISDSPADVSPGMSFAQMAKREWQKIQRKICPCRSMPPTIPKPRSLYIPKYWTDDKDYLSSSGKPIGIVTLEDVIEALIQSSILDEKDISLGRRRMKGTGSLNSSRIITSSEQTSAPNTRESLATSSEEKSQAPPFSPNLCDTRLNLANGIDHQQNKFAITREEPPLSPLIPVSGGSERGRRRRVSFPDGYLEGDGAPYLSHNMESFNGSFKSKTFPRNKGYGTVKTDSPPIGFPLVDLLGPMSEEDVGFVTVPEHDIDALDDEGHVAKIGRR